MPTTLTYPGVYVEEIPSGVRTITGVATSITAFVGRTRRGPTNEPITINNFGDFERIYGGLWEESSVSFAVRDFYRNGGRQAIILRLDNGADPATLTRDALTLRARDHGSWGNNIRVRIEHDADDDVLPDEVASRLGVDRSDLFNLTVRDTRSGATESFLNLTMSNSLRNVDEVLARESTLIRADKPDDQAPRPSKHEIEVPPGQDIWSDRDISQPPSSTPQDPQVRWSTKASGGGDGDTLERAQFARGQVNEEGEEDPHSGLYALEKVDLFNLLCIPPYTEDRNVDEGVITDAATLCEDRRTFLLVDPPTGWANKEEVKKGINEQANSAKIGTHSKNAAVFFPRLMQANPLRDNQVEPFVPSGAVAGVFARTDAQRGVWKAPAGLAATLAGVSGLFVTLTNEENGELNPLGVNCLRAMPPAGSVVWGARTLEGDDRLASEWKYIPVRRLALFIEESLYRGTQWVVFEPNDEPLWSQIRLNVGAFMRNLFRQGAFQGASPRDAYFVKCDNESTTQNDINLGIVNIVVGFAPLKPAEFVVLKIQQIAGEILT
jgi:phage tail sheath protein FI